MLFTFYSNENLIINIYALVVSNALLAFKNVYCLGQYYLCVV